MELLPLGISSFKELRTPNEDGQRYVYVDKTEGIRQLVKEYRFVFLSRPRRFGKSLLISTIEYLFSGQKALFEGLWIENHWNWAAHHPVLRIDFNYIVEQQVPLAEALSIYLHQLAQAHQIELTHPGVGGQFRQLYQQLYQKTGQKVVVLIDEYDKAITDYLDDMPTAEANRSLLRHFFVVLKGAEEMLRFVLFTGVSKIGKLSIFSGLNNVKDITLSPRYTTLLGYTDKELDSYFSANIKAWANKTQITYKALRQDFTRWYNGYSWGGSQKVYNPWSVLNALDDQVIRGFWHETGTPKFLIDALKQQSLPLPDLEGFWATEDLQGSASLEDMNARSLLWQTGYLTVKGMRGYDDDTEYQLGLPNREVRKALLVSYLADGWPHASVEPRSLAGRLKRALESNNLEDFFAVVKLMIAAVPYHQHSQPGEAFFHTVIHMALMLSGVEVATEVAMATGRIDAVATTVNFTFIFELKLTTPEEALAQIKANNYAAPYLNQGKTVITVGAAFNAKQRTLSGWVSKQA